MPNHEGNTSLSATPGKRLAAQIAELTAAATAEARLQIGPAEAELVDARDAFVHAEARLELAATTVRELQDLIGNIPNSDLVMTRQEVERHNGEIYMDERVDPMVFGHSQNSNP